MGKSKKRSRASKNRLNPLANNSNNSNNARNAKKDASLIANRIQPMIKNLQSAIPNDRNMAISSISVMCEDPHMRQLLLKEKLIQIILTNLLNDDNLDIVIESLGLLRNLTLEEGYDIAIHLWRSDIWTHIKDGLSKIVKSLGSMIADNDIDNNSNNNNTQKKDLKAFKNSRRLLFDYADNLISLIVALSNGSDDILDEILKDDKLHEILYTIVKFIEYGFDKLQIPLQNTLLDLIYDFSSESLDFIDSVIACEPIARLLNQLSNSEQENELTQILSQGIRLQFIDGVMDEQVTATNCNEILLSAINSITKIDLEKMKNSLYNNMIDNNDNSTNIDTTKLKDYAKAKQEGMMQLQAIEIGIDVITGTIEIVASTDVKVDDSLTHTLVDTIPQFLAALLREFPDRILIAWNNLLWMYVTIGYQTEPQLLLQLWGQIINTDVVVGDDLAIKIGKMSVMWVILKLCGMLSYIDLLNEIKVWNNKAFIDSIIIEFNNNKDVEFRQRCCGILTTIASFQGQSTEINRTVGQFLLGNMVLKETDPALLVDMTQSIFEIYGDKSFDYDTPVFVDGDFLAILKDKIVPNLREQFKMVDKNKSPELKERCTQCFNTLDSFIHYKANERA